MQTTSFWFYDKSFFYSYRSLLKPSFWTTRYNGKEKGFDNMINDDYDIYLLILDNQEMGVDTTQRYSEQRRSFLLRSNKSFDIYW